ncbi:MAG: anhydro-N-acetylmuramic acid kinase [Oscillatoriaceae bacterium SKW80]|nr:anhydro-N-acetylmuramic acid kinase [Oscillatoriaceae bacterium SKYG93]MCX8122206.1 anhydro-N-acetylmuramic acid kinase [Oscillatoriaceae bacterium SKW80]MDW8454492.1 anhydro-N-acetylmuramic acid kinase [Oscillatoriaceae cyanobacterium SKYGB_i_bin93]HIK29353.1 anhydro-N-acetylmuramic acid kinase [Oscillatoriaceae cyanobacterium M7585_C2015_266]
MTIVIGLISGTSVDGIDAALVDIRGKESDLQVELLAAATYPYPKELRARILAVCGGAAISVAELAELDDAVAEQFALAALAIKGDRSVELIGSHGQTVYHRPPCPGNIEHLGYSLQIARGAVLARITGITTVNNFRAADIAAGGQGAPLVSKIDACLLTHSRLNRCVQNIGGIGNVTYLPSASSQGQTIIGWDTGPGNVLIDMAVQQLSNGKQTYDKDGTLAASGTPCKALVEKWMQHPFFHQPPPKSTGRELFGFSFLQQCLADANSYYLSDADTLATLTELTAVSIVHSYRNFLPQMPDEVLLCGGGSRNLYLKQRLQALLAPVQVRTTDEAGLNADFKEAIAFAVLAYWRILGIPGNLPQVTAARYPVLLGDVHVGV